MKVVSFKWHFLSLIFGGVLLLALLISGGDRYSTQPINSMQTSPQASTSSQAAESKQYQKSSGNLTVASNPGNDQPLPAATNLQSTSESTPTDLSTNSPAPVPVTQPPDGDSGTCIPTSEINCTTSSGGNYPDCENLPCADLSTTYSCNLGLYEYKYNDAHLCPPPLN